MRAEILFKWCKKMAIYVSVIFSVAACTVPVLEPAETFRFELEGISGDKSFSFQQYYTCYQTADLSAADGKFHKHWNASGSSTQVGQVAEDLFIIYNVWGCNSNTSKKSVIAAVDSIEKPTILYLFRVQPIEPLLTITKDRSVPVGRSEVSLGPSSTQVQLKEKLRENQNGFQRVTAKIIPYEIFATANQSKEYFDKQTEIAIAEQQNRAPCDRVFPFFSERDFSKLRNSGEYMKVQALSFNGEEFTFDGPSFAQRDVLYSTPETRSWKSPWFEPDVPPFSVALGFGVLGLI